MATSLGLVRILKHGGILSLATPACGHFESLRLVLAKAFMPVIFFL